MLPSRFGSYPVAVVFAAAFFFSCNCQGPGINNGTDGGVGVFDGGLSDALYVEPAMAEVVVKQKNVTHSQQFVAKDAKTMVPLTVGWVLDRDDLGKIDQSGLFTTQSLVGGIIKVRANSNGLWAEATLLVRVEIKEDAPAGTGPVDPDTLPHLNAPTPNTGTQGPKILYPYANTVFPRGIISPLVQYDPMGFQPKATRVTITAPNFI